MKKLIATLLTLVLLLSLCAPAFAEAAHTITSEAYPVYKEAEPLGGDLTLYFLDGVKDLPYLEINTWTELLNGFYYERSGKAISFEMKVEGPIVTYTRSNTNAMADDNFSNVVFDFDRNYIEFSDYNLFTLRPESATPMDTVTLSTHNAAGEPTLLQKVDTGSYNRYGDALRFDLAAYNIDLIQQDGLYLIPLATISDIFMPNTMCGQFFFNGKYVMMASTIDDCTDLYYEAPTGERSPQLAEYGYNELCLMLDYFYGLKETHDIDSFDKLFKNVGFEPLLKGSEVKQADAAIYRMITDFLDDGHSNWRGYSYLTGPIDYKASGMSKNRILDHRTRQTEARAKFYPDGVPGYEEVGNTAYITFDQFENVFTDPDEYYTIEDKESIPENDIFGLVIKAHEQINRENSPIENVVLDLSCNGGGADNVAAYVTAWFLGECCISNVDNMTGAMSTTVYKADTNLDRVFDEKDNLGGKRLFCLESPFSFSNGNYVPCALKESGRVTLLGRTSGGGSCNVLYASSAWGTSFQISANTRVSFLKNGSFYDVDRGAEPDFVIPTPEQYYDRAALTDYINSLIW